MNTAPPRIVIASLYKPVDDTRMYEKYGQALKEGAKFEIFIIGRKINFDKVEKDIHFVELEPPDRLSFKRFLLAWQVFWKILKLRPAALLVCTHELLPAAVLCKFLFKTKIIYDVQENYFSNLWHQRSYVWGIHFLLALWVRTKERICLAFFDGAVLAEHCYAREMPFITRRPYYVLPNVFSYQGRIAAESLVPKQPVELRLVYAGTVARPYGILQAIHLADALRCRVPGLRLTVVGHVPDSRLHARLQRMFLTRAYIINLTDTRPVPHALVLREMKAADFGLLAYLPGNNLDNRVPTKLYEFACLGVPMLINRHKASVKITQSFAGGISFDFENVDEKLLLEQMKNGKFYTVPYPPDFWFSVRKFEFVNFINKIVIG